MLTKEDVRAIESDIDRTYEFNGGQLVAELLKEWKEQRETLAAFGVELVDE